MMVVMILECVPTVLRGELSRWLTPVGGGVHVGQISALVRGELWGGTPLPCQENGPSPRVRGELPGCLQDAIDLRAIPACAGRTPEAPASLSVQDGPSPRVRGERASGASGFRFRTGHPRVCGENLQ